jgi:hypothetical protein
MFRGRSAVLGGYVDVARAVGLDPYSSAMPVFPNTALNTEIPSLASAEKLRGQRVSQTNRPLGFGMET